MSTKHSNPHREKSNYGRLFGVIQKSQVVARSQLLKANKDKDNPAYDVDVLLSPTETNQGSYSARGDLYYMERLKIKTVKGKNEEQRYRLRWRDPSSPLAERKIRTVRQKVDAEKVEVTEAVKETKETKETKAKETAKA